MSNLVAVAYPDEATAREVGQTLMELQKEHSIELEDLAIAVRQDDGKIKLKQTFSPTASGATGGALWGGLIGLIFFMPLLGAAIGGATGAATGALTDVGVDDKFMKELGEKLQPGGAAVFVLVSQSTPDKVLPRISQYGGEVIHSSLSERLLVGFTAGTSHQRAASLVQGAGARIEGRLDRIGALLIRPRRASAT